MKTKIKTSLPAVLLVVVFTAELHAAPLNPLNFTPPGKFNAFTELINSGQPQEFFRPQLP